MSVCGRKDGFRMGHKGPDEVDNSRGPLEGSNRTYGGCGLRNIDRANNYHGPCVTGHNIDKHICSVKGMTYPPRTLFSDP